ncbi:7tm Chemosensory receptor [Nesidiocoris tenuis]|uniref:Gustatory receptor n=1 Tax=Nesidiocoris tenuis TaxID=355587 RepID=A0ABN7AZZ8_9HEMI|nr:7tm Chemosensory receptor [Nesidiocoris tenuis]
MPFAVSHHPLRLRVSPFRLALGFALFILTFCNVYYTLAIKYGTAPMTWLELANVSLLEKVSHSATSTFKALLMKTVNPTIVLLMNVASLYVTIFSVRRRLPKFVDGLVQVDLMLSQLTRNVLIIHRHLYLIVLGFMVAMPIPSFGYYIYSISDDNVIWSLAQVYHNSVGYSCEVQMLIFLLVLGNRFQVINEAFPSRSSKDLLFQTWLHPSDSLCSHMERITVAKVELAQECYLRLCDLFTLLQSAYSAQILFSAGGCFLKTLLNVYSTFSDTQVSSSSGDELMKQQTKTIRTYLWTYYYLARFLVQAVAASATTNQALRTQLVVSSLRTKDLERPVKDSLYSFWKITSSRNLAWSACGLFTLGTHIIVEASSTGLTYLFILIQYRLQIDFP